MINFDTQAEELLLEAERYESELSKLVRDLIINKPYMDNLAGQIINMLIITLEEATQEKYSTKQISEILGIAEWKIRRYITSQKLIAESNKLTDGNPGRSGYSIKKEDLIKFIQENSQEILINSTKAKSSFALSIVNIIKTLKNFIDRIDPLIYLGNLELKVAELELKQAEETIEILEKKIQLHKLNMEKKCFEEWIKKLEKYLPEPILENSTEQTPETK